MRIIYDPETDTLDLIFRDDPIVESDEIRQGVIADYNREGKMVSLEFLDASALVDDPQSVAYELKRRQKVT